MVRGHRGVQPPAPAGIPEHLCPLQQPLIPDPAQPLPIHRQLLALLLLRPRSPSKFSSSSCSPCQQLGLIHHLLSPCSGCAGEELICPLPESPHVQLPRDHIHPSFLIPIPDWEGCGSRGWRQQEGAAGSLSTNSCLTRGDGEGWPLLLWEGSFPTVSSGSWNFSWIGGLVLAAAPQN